MHKKVMELQTKQANRKRARFKNDHKAPVSQESVAEVKGD